MLFISPYRIAYTMVLLFQYFATLACVVGSYVAYPLTWYMDNVEVHQQAKLQDRGQKKIA